MAEFTKDVIKPGIFHAEGRDVEVTESDIDRWVDNFNKMRESGLHVPVPFEHPDEDDPFGRPMSASARKRYQKQKRAKYNAGWVEDFYVEDGVLKAKLNIPGEDDAKRLQEVGSFVSPEFGTFTDGKKNRWENSIAHLAFTPRPINSDQTKTLEPVPAGDVTESFSLSMERVVSFAGDDDAIPSGDDDSGDDPVIPTPDGDDDSSNADASSRLRQLLSSIGVVVPEGAELTGDLDILNAAIESHLATKAKMKEEADAAAAAADNSQQNQPPIKQEDDAGTIVSMAADDEDDDDDSAGGIEKLKSALGGLGLKIDDESALGDDAEFVADLLGSIANHMAYRERRRKERESNESGIPVSFSTEDDEVSKQELTRMSSEVSLMNDELTTLRREKYDSRIEALFSTGRIDPPTRDKLVKQAGTFKFSLDSSQSNTELDLMLNTYEGLPQGTFWSDEEKIERFSVSEEGRTRFFDDPSGEPADDEADDLVDDMHPHLAAK